jgi:MFS family permease
LGKRQKSALVGRQFYNHRMSSSATAVSARIALYLALVQCFFALGWTVYVLFLPDLLTRAGVDKSWTPWVLALDQVIFAAADLTMGIAIDRARTGLRRMGPLLLGLTAVSSLAMLLMPFAAGLGHSIFLGFTLIWVVTSAALRAPPFALLGRYAARSELPRLVSLQLVGLALASALAPYLGLVLKGIDPAIPFALASLAILASSSGLVIAERRLIQNQTPATETASVSPLPFSSPLALLMMGALLAAALGFQWHVAINAAAQVKRAADPSWIPWILPIFWGGFAFGLLPAGTLAKRLGNARAAGLGCVLGGVGLALGSGHASLAMVSLAHATAGFGWALMMACGIALATSSGRSGAEGRYTSLFFSLMALGTLARIGLNLGGVPQALQSGADWLPVASWAAAAVLLLKLSSAHTIRIEK